MRIKIKELRSEKGWTQFQTAIESGVSVDMIRSIEIGRTLPGLVTALKLKKALGCNYIEDLIDEAV